MPSDLPLKVLPDETPDAQTYTIALPTRFDDSGNVEAFEFPKSVPPEVAMAQIREANKRDAADTQIQKTLDPEYRKNIPFEDFKQWKNDPRVVGDTSVDVNYTDLIVDGAKAVGKGAINTGLNFASMVASLDQKKAARAGLNIVEGGLQGTERLGGLITMAGLLAKKGASKLFSDADHTDQIDYELYKKAIAMQETEQRRASGDLIVDQAAKAMGIQLPEASKQDIAEANSISNFLDASIFAGPLIGKGLGALIGASGRAALAKMAPSAVANLAGRAAMAGAEYSGKALDYATRKIIQGIDTAVGTIAENAMSRGAQIIGNRAVAFGLATTETGGAFIQTALAGKALRTVGEIGGTVLKAAAEDVPLRGALRELTETTGSDVVRFFARQSLKIAPSDTVFDAMKHVAAAATNTGFVSGTLSAMQAAAAQDDPVHGFMEGFASGLGGGAVVGLAGAKGAAKEQQFKRVAEFFDNDMRSRQPVVGLNVDGQEIKINDINGRLTFFNREDLTPEQKQFTLQLTQANERAGGTVIFHDGSPEMAQALESVGLGAGEGVQYFNGEDGRSTILLNAKDMTHGTAVEEVFHAMTTDSIIREVSNAINFNIKSDATANAAPVAATPGAFAPKRGAAKQTNYLGDAMDFAERYIQALEASGVESGRAKAAEFRQRIARVALDPEMMPDIKADVLKPIINEYAANYARAALAGMKPRNLMEGGLRNIWDSIWDKTMSNLLSAFDMSKQGAAKDSITGHFFDEKGRRVINPQLEGLVDRFLTSASENLKANGKKVTEIMPENVSSGVHYFDVRSEKPFVSYEDVIDGRQTTAKEKKQKLNESFKMNSEFLNSASGDDHVVVVNQRLKQDGAFPGNITQVKDGTQLIFSQGLPETFFDHLARTGQISQEQVKVNKLLNRSMVAGQVVMLDAWADVGRNLRNREEVYYGRGNRAFLAISAQQAPTGGVTWNGLDVTRVWDYAKRASRKIKAVREEFKARDIVSLQEFIPYLQQYFDNYSSHNPIPAAELKGFSPVMRDVISTALNIKNRTSAAFAEIDAQNFKNPASFNADLVGREGANIMTAYRKGAITYREQMEGLAGAGRAGKVVRLGEEAARRTVLKARESVSLLQVRADRVLGISDFSIGGAPVPIKYNPYRVTNLVRANFSPGRTVVEKLGDSEVYTDAVNGKRIIVKPNGKATLFDEGRKSIHESVDEAIDRANINASRDDVSFAPSRKTKARKAEPTPEEQLQFDADSTANAFQNTSLPARALSDKIARLYQNGSITLDEMQQGVNLLNNPDISYTGARQASAEYVQAALKNMQLYRQGLISYGEMESGLRAVRSMEAGRQAKASVERRARLSEMESKYLPQAAQEEVAAFMAAQRAAQRDVNLGQAELRYRKEQARAMAQEEATRSRQQPESELTKVADRVEVKDPRIPSKVRIVRTPSGRYRVFYGTGLVGVKEKEEKAIQLAQKYAS